jgi:hypothetical protein
LVTLGLGYLEPRIIETVRLAAEALQREGLLVKIRRKGTFIQSPQGDLQLQPVESKLLGYLQVDYRTTRGQEEEANRAISGVMLQGALAEAGRAGFRLVVQHTPHTQLREGFSQLHEHTHLRGVIFASYGEEKLEPGLREPEQPTLPGRGAGPTKPDVHHELPHSA